MFWSVIWSLTMASIKQLQNARNAFVFLGRSLNLSQPMVGWNLGTLGGFLRKPTFSHLVSIPRSVWFFSFFTPTKHIACILHNNNNNKFTENNKLLKKSYSSAIKKLSFWMPPFCSCIISIYQLEHSLYFPHCIFGTFLLYYFSFFPLTIKLYPCN